MSHYSSVKLTENNVKKLITVPSKWVIGKCLYYPKDKFMERKLAKNLADPEESWREIPIEQEMLRFRTVGECDAVRSGTEYDTSDTEESSQKSSQKRKISEASFESSPSWSLPGATAGITPKSDKRALVTSSSEKKKRLTENLADATSRVLNEPLPLHSEISHKKSTLKRYKNFEDDMDEDDDFEMPDKPISPPPPNSHSSNRHSSYHSLNHHLPHQQSSNRHLPHQQSSSHHSPHQKSSNHQSPHQQLSNHQSPSHQSPSRHSLNDHQSNHHSPVYHRKDSQQAAAAEIDMFVGKRLDDRLNAIEKSVADVNERQRKLLEQLVKIHELLKFRDRNDNVESTIPSIENQEDFESVESALESINTKSELVSTICYHCLYPKMPINFAFFSDTI
eukprot:TCONS_00033814-protein